MDHQLEVTGHPHRESIVNDCKANCKMRELQRKAVRKLCNKYKLHLTVTQKGAKDALHYGPHDGHQIRMGLIERHYFSYTKLDVTLWSLKQFQSQLLDNWASHERIHNWHTTVSFTGDHSYRRDNTKGISSWTLMNHLINNSDELLTQIDQSTANLHASCFMDQVSPKFGDLRYPPEAVQPAHPVRHLWMEEDESEEYKELEKQVQSARKQVGCAETLERLDSKFRRMGMGLEEQLKILRRHKAPAARVFFDFEATSTPGQHKPYMVCWKHESDDEIEVAVGAQCAQKMLDQVAEQYGRVCPPGRVNNFLPEVQLIAHNITYDASFLMKHLMTARDD